jgi:hypothetical protein
VVSGGKSKISKNVSWLKEIQDEAVYKPCRICFVKYHIIQTRKKTNITKIY